MSFNPDLSKKTQEAFLAAKDLNLYIFHEYLIVTRQYVSNLLSKHLDVFLDERLIFEEHFKVILSKINKIIGLLRKLQNLLQGNALIIICKYLIRPHLD